MQNKESKFSTHFNYIFLSYEFCFYKSQILLRIYYEQSSSSGMSMCVPILVFSVTIL